MKKNIYKLKNEKGIALLFAMLLTSTLLLVATGISRYAYKEMIFSTEARESDRAFSAADTGIECALYLDKLGVFGTTYSGTPFCSGGAAVIVSSISSTQKQFILNITTGTYPLCVQVFVDKNVSPGTGCIAATGGTCTHIEADGFNQTAAGASLTPPVCVLPTATPGTHLVERVLKASYVN